jgi:hypothetical protein
MFQYVRQHAREPGLKFFRVARRRCGGALSQPDAAAFRAVSLEYQGMRATSVNAF